MCLPLPSSSVSFNSEYHLQLITPHQNWTCGRWLSLALSYSLLHMTLQANKSSGNLSKSTSFSHHNSCKSIFQCSSFHAHLFSRETMTVNIKKYKSRRHSMVATLAPAGCISWKHTALHGNSRAYQKLVLEEHADLFKSRSSKYNLHCKEKHLEGPNSLGTKTNIHVLLMCIFSAILETDISFQLISASDMHWEIYSIFWGLQSISINLQL